MIKIDMEMPDSCEECLLNYEGYCQAIGLRVDGYDVSIHCNCKLIECEDIQAT